ncbi:MAG: hypothetical protein Q4F23_02215 [Coriobacteriia bacterium]|nr:hypothetical protein [Coriobacteriia bacterium]
MSVLFSPIGTADPITQLGDGPMLHILRHRKPEKVILYLSPAMIAFEAEDHRYTRAIELLYEQLGISPAEVTVVHSVHEEVFRFDLFINDFEEILSGIEPAEGPLLVNVSSGTAGMSQALVALGSFGRIDLELLQVLTPKKGINSRFDRESPEEYDLDFLWELDSEIESNAESRIVRVVTPNFAQRLMQENIITLVKGYEYEAAVEFANQMDCISLEAKRKIEAAAARLNLDGNLPAQVFSGKSLGFKRNDLVLEYLYMMEVRLKQGHWAEFVRALTPAFTELMRRVLAPYLPDRKYQTFKNGEPTGKYDVNAIDDDPRLAQVLYRCHYHNKDAYITNDAYCRLVGEYCETDRTIDLVNALRKVEWKSRNSLAHSLRSSSRSSIERECGMTLREIMDSLFELHDAAGDDCLEFHGPAEPGLYDRVNESIISCI